MPIFVNRMPRLPDKTDLHIDSKLAKMMEAKA
jgi:hypothetical protein